MRGGLWFVSAAALAAAAGQAQVVLNEVFENPPGSVDPRYEFIELYGPPGMSLDGYALALAKGGSDLDNDNILDFGSIVEIDEAFALDGFVIGSNGLFVIYNDTGAASFIPAMVAPGTSLATFTQCHIATSDTPGNIANDESSTYVLVRKRPMTPSDPFGTAWRKDTPHDPNFSGHFSFGDPFQPGTLMYEPYQMVDDVAWSHQGGKEYTRSKEQEISGTQGFNPDCISRVAYYGENPQRGHRFNDSGFIVFTRTADEEWVYGEVESAVTLAYDDDGRLEGTLLINVAKGPTNPSAPGFSGACDPDQPWDTTGAQCLPDGGAFKFTNIDLTNFVVTPGRFNDAGSVTQFRYVPGDFNFDGAASYLGDYRRIHDLHRANVAAQASPILDESAAKVFDNDTPSDSNDDYHYTGWRFEGREFNGVMAMMRMNLTDGTAGANGVNITRYDVRDTYPLVCMSDLSGSSDPNDSAYGVPDGLTDSSDFFYFLDQFVSNNLEVDFSGSADPNDPEYGAPDQALDSADFFFYLDRFVAGCL
jgi:hypothetical protein